MPKMPLTTRMDANIGYDCNNNCLFCYFMHRKKTRCNLSTKETKKLFFSIRSLGIESLEITGGEPTIREDILALIAYAKNELKFKRISVITNGSMFSDMSFATKAVESGIGDMLVSLHGHNAQLHDRLTGRPGSFEEALRAIHNVKKLGIHCRTNTVVTRLNFMHVSDIAKLCWELGMGNINFIFFSPLDDAVDAQKEFWPRYFEAAPFIKEMIDRFKDKIKIISIKNIPFCQLEGYEQHITNFYQNIYDPFEWDLYKRIRVRRSFFVSSLAALVGFMAFMDLERIKTIGLRRSIYEGVVRFHAFLESSRSKRCRSCRFCFICSGLWKRYAKIFGLEECRPIKGNRIRNVDEFLFERFGDYCSQ